MTTETPTALIVTTGVDAASDAVESVLLQQGTRYARVNTEAFPFCARASIRSPFARDSFVWKLEDRAISLEAVRRVWFRRHRLPTFPETLHRAHAEYCLRESDWFFRGELLALAEYVDQQDWMSHPLALQRAESKVLQLQLAARVGMQCPDSLISNDPKDLRRFYDEHDGRVIAKPLRLGYFDYGDEQTAAFTTALADSDLDDEDAIRVAPVIYQEHLPKCVDIRVTIVEDTVFAASIHSQATESARVDWRSTTTDLPHFRHELPRAVGERCMDLMRALSLKYGALDLVLTPEGDYVFLEVNPNGQWLWIEDKLEFPITSKIASWLNAGTTV